MINLDQSQLRIWFNTRRSLLAAVTVVLASVAILVFGVWNQLQELVELRSQVSAEQPKLERLERKLLELQNIHFIPEFAQAELVNAALPSRKPLVELLTSLGTMSSASEVRIDNFRLSPGLIATESAQSATRGSSRGIDSLELSMRVSGQPVAVREFLMLVEKMTPFTTITRLSVDARSLQADDRDLTMTAQLVTETYFFTQTVEAAIEAPLPQLTEAEQRVLAELTAFTEHDFPEQTEIIGGLEDLFGADPLEFLEL